MRSGTERRKFFFDQRKNFFDRGPLRLPCEMKRHGRSLVAWTHPQIVCCNRAELGDEKMWRDLVSKLLNGKDCGVAFVAGNEVLRLQFCSTAWREIHAKVGESFVPRAGNTHLLSTIFRRVPGERMQVVGCRLRAVEICFWICMRALINTALDPHLGRAMVLPVCEDTDAITARKDIVEVMFELRKR